MIIRQVNVNHCWKNKNILFAILLILAIAFCGCQQKKYRLKKQIIGSHYVDFENSSWSRHNNDTYLFDGEIIFYDDSVFLPIISKKSDSIFHSKYDILDERFEKDMDNQLRLEEYHKRTSLYSKQAKGKWMVINTQPDSIMIFAPNHPLNGKYAISFSEPSKYAIDPYFQTFTYVLFENDSTFFLCKKY